MGVLSFYLREYIDILELPPDEDSDDSDDDDDRDCDGDNNDDDNNDNNDDSNDQNLIASHPLPTIHQLMLSYLTSFNLNNKQTN